MPYDPNEIIETIHMTEVEHLDIRTVTLGVSLRGCAHPDASKLASNIREKLLRVAGNHVKTVETPAVSIRRVVRITRILTYKECHPERSRRAIQ